MHQNTLRNLSDHFCHVIYWILLHSLKQLWLHQKMCRFRWSLCVTTRVGNLHHWFKNDFIAPEWAWVMSARLAYDYVHGETSRWTISLLYLAPARSHPPPARPAWSKKLRQFCELLSGFVGWWAMFITHGTNGTQLNGICNMVTDECD